MLDSQCSIANCRVPAVQLAKLHSFTFFSFPPEVANEKAGQVKNTFLRQMNSINSSPPIDIIHKSRTDTPEKTHKMQHPGEQNASNLQVQLASTEQFVLGMGAIVQPNDTRPQLSLEGWQQSRKAQATATTAPNDMNGKTNV